MSNLTTELQAIALQFARDCYSVIEDDSGYGRKYMPAQIYPQVEVFVTNDFWETPDLENFTIVQLGMIADAQLKSDADYWIMIDDQQRADDLAYEQLIQDTIAMGANDRKTAIRWLNDTELEDAAA